jgi:hypothetical protein
LAAAVAVPLVAIGGLALLSPLALGRKKRDVDGAFDDGRLASHAPRLNLRAKLF